MRIYHSPHLLAKKIPTPLRLTTLVEQRSSTLCSQSHPSMTHSFATTRTSVDVEQMHFPSSTHQPDEATAKKWHAFSYKHKKLLSSKMPQRKGPRKLRLRKQRYVRHQEDLSTANHGNIVQAGQHQRLNQYSERRTRPVRACLPCPI